MSGPDSYRVMINRKGENLLAGYVTNREGRGWRFLPMFQASPSRKVWETAEKAVGRRVRNYWLEPNVKREDLRRSVQAAS